MGDTKHCVLRQSENGRKKERQELAVSNANKAALGRVLKSGALLGTQVLLVNGCLIK